MATHKNKSVDLPATAWVRVGLYVLTVIVALAAVIAPFFGQGEYVSLLNEVAVLLGVFSGGTAALNIEKNPDRDLREVLHQGSAVYDEVKHLRQGQPVQPAQPVNQQPAPVDPNSAESSAIQAGSHPATAPAEKPFSVYHQPITD